MRPYKFIISGGGTGGHIYPAIAIADALKSLFPSARFLFVGAIGKMEMQKVPKAGYSIKGIWISGFQRGSIIKNLLLPFKLVISFFQSVIILLRFRPDFVIGTGGFVSGTILLIAHYFKIKTLIQEQNSFAGITNKILGKKVDLVAVAFPKMEQFFPKEKIIFTGNPIRESLITIDKKRDEALLHFGLDSNKKTLVVLGGSLGAKIINELIQNHLAVFSEKNLQVIWQCGKMYFDTYKKHSSSKNIFVYDFIEQMDLLYAAADVFISRAGASSISELSIVGKPMILIPSTNVAENHQMHNASALSNVGGALLLPESQIEKKFVETFEELLSLDTDEVRKQLNFFAKPKATKEIVNHIKNRLEVNEF